MCFTGISSHSGRVNGLHFTADGLHLISMGTENKLHLWNTSSGRNTHTNFGRITNPGRRNVQFSVSEGAKREMIFVPDGRMIKVLDTYTGRHLYSLNGHYTRVDACYYHPDLQELYSGGSDSNLLVWTSSSRTTQTVKPQTVTVKKEEERDSVQVAVTADSWSSDEES